MLLTNFTHYTAITITITNYFTLIKYTITLLALYLDNILTLDSDVFLPSKCCLRLHCMHSYAMLLLVACSYFWYLSYVQ